MSFFNKTTYDWLIVGLGNPGQQYEKSRHNTGFLVLDALSRKLQVKINRVKFKAVTAPAEYEGRKLLLMKPETFMNASGIAVEAAAHYYHIPADRILVIYDDVSLPVGRIRIRAEGSAGGHNGIKSIIAMLHTEGFPRVKVGVGEKPHPDYDLADWVLSAVPKEEQPSYAAAIQEAADAALCVVTSDCQKAASVYNGKHIS